MRVRFGPFWMTACVYFSLSLVAQAHFNVTTNADNTLTIVNYTGGVGSIEIPSSIDGRTVTVIRGQAFSGNVILTRVTIPNTVTNIGSEAFRDCFSLTNITIGSGVASMGGQAFWRCTNLISVVISNGVKSIGDSAFGYCTRLPSIIIPDSVTNIHSSAFKDCIMLTNAVIGNGAKGIGDWAFYKCTRMSNISIGSGVNNIGDWVFDNCSSLTSITVNASNASYSSTNGVLFNKNKTTLFRYPEGKGGNYSVPASVTSIRYSSFYNCTNLTGVAIGGVTNIGASAFSDCTRLATLTISNSLTPIGSFAFDGCRSLADVMIGNGVTSIGSNAFRNCTTIGSVTIPGSVASIDDNAFYLCGGLANVIISNGVSNIRLGAFAYCTNLSSIVIGHGVTNMGQSVFYNCTRLSSVAIPDSVRSIGNYAFKYCKNLSSATIGSGVTSIGLQAFEECIKLNGVYFRGNAPPNVSQPIFNYANNVVVYYIMGTAGWPPVPDTWFGRPTALWNAESLSINPTSTNFSSTAFSERTISIVANIAWTAASNASWIAITGGAAGSGNGTATFSVATNPATSSRTGGIVVAGGGISLTCTVVQAGATSSLAINPTSTNISNAATGGLIIGVTGNVSWTAVSNVAWLAVTGGSSGSGNGTVTYSVATNSTSSSRTGGIVVAGGGISLTCRVVQAGVSAPAVPAAPIGVSATDGIYTDRVQVSWSASSGATGYVVWRFTNNNSSLATPIAHGLTGLLYNDTNVTVGTIYYYWLQAANSGGASGFSSSDSGYAMAALSSLTGTIPYGGSQTGLIHVTACSPEGIPDLVLTLDGIDDGIIVETPTIALHLTNQMTMCAWLKVAGGLTGNFSTILVKFESEAGRIAYYFGLNSKNGMPYASFGDGNNYEANQGVGVTNGWTHIAFSHDGTVGTWYINGQTSSQINKLPIRRSGVGSLYFGRYSDLQDYFNRFPGQLDDISLWTKALSQVEINQVMSNKLAGSETGLAGYWNFNDGSASNLSENANHGQFLYGATTTVGRSTGLCIKSNINSPGLYAISNVPAGEYSIHAYRDSTGNGSRDSWEAYGVYMANPLTVTGTMQNIDIVLQDPITDTDGDGLTDYDEVYVYGTLWDNPDSDGDGMSDGDEIIAGSDPNDPASIWSIATPTYGGTWHTNVVWYEGAWVTQAWLHAERCILEWQTLTGRIYRLYGTTNLAGLWEANSMPIAGTGDSVSFTNENIDPQKWFFRLGVELIP